VRGTSRVCRDGRGGRSSVVEVRECRAQVTEGKQPIVEPKRRSWRPCSGSAVAAVERPPGSATQGSAMAPHRRPRPSWVCPPLLVAEGGPPLWQYFAACRSAKRRTGGLPSKPCDGQSNAIRSQTSSPRNLENRVRRRARDCRPCRLSARKRHLQSLPTDGPSPTVARGTVAVCEKATGLESSCARRALGYSQNPLCTARACSTRWGPLRWTLWSPRAKISRDLIVSCMFSGLPLVMRRSSSWLRANTTRRTLPQ
jgi:hypothetical protein